MNGRLPATLAAIGVFFVLLYNSVFVVNERQQAIVVRFGKIQSVETQPGLYFKMPFTFLDADTVMKVPDQALRFDLNDIRVQVKDGKFYEVDAFVVYRIANAQKFRETVSADKSSAESRLRTRLDASLRRIYGLRGFESALSKERASMMTEVQADLKSDAESLGINITDVRIRRTDLTKEVSQQTFDRMKAERLAEAELIRASGNEEKQRKIAVADRESVEIVASAQKDAEIIRGEGDAQRNRIFAEAFTKDPAFFEFYRSMNAYSASLATPDTTMVISPESEFFKFFGNSAGAPPAAKATPAAGQ